MIKSKAYEGEISMKKEKDCKIVISSQDANDYESVISSEYEDDISLEEEKEKKLSKDDNVERRLDSLKSFLSRSVDDLTFLNPEVQKIVWDHLHKYLKNEISMRDVSKEICNQLKLKNVRNIILLENP
ncbi:16395_t:CDS:2, partial [Cetraspora pellucida]